MSIQISAKEKSFRAKMIKTTHDWCNENAYDCYIIISVDENCRVPTAYVNDGQIAFSLHPDSCQALNFTADFITFEAMFDEGIQHIIIPIERVASIFESEEQKGLVFEVAISEKAYETANQSTEKTNNPMKNKSLFKIIK
jgi:stringent starvation protein B